MLCYLACKNLIYLLKEIDDDTFYVDGGCSCNKSQDVK